MYRQNKKHEFYTEKSQKEGYPARSVYKLEEINLKHKIFKEGDKVLDLGSAPGSWILYISKIIGPKGLVIGMDMGSLRVPLAPNMLFLKSKIRNIDLAMVQGKFNGKCQSVVADLAPFTSGMREYDAGKSFELAMEAFEIAEKMLEKGGNFVCKIFEGEDSDEFFEKVAQRFEFCKRAKPKAVIKDSREFYVVAKGFKNE